MEPLSVREMRFVGSETLCRVRSFPAEISFHRREEKKKNNQTSDDFESSCFDTPQNLVFAFFFQNDFNLRLVFPQLFPVVLCRVRQIS